MNGRIKKKYYEAQTPYFRVMRSKSIKMSKKIQLAQEYQKLNPAELQRKLFIKLRALREKIMVSKTNLATTLKKI